jgi:muramoyltetrapeptide carboxypeptidase
VAQKDLEPGLARLRAWGADVVLAPNLGKKLAYLAGSDQERLEGLQAVLDAGARTVIAARGGYGISRLLPKLPWRRLERDQVRFAGFSDVTVLLNALAARGIPQVHGPMVAAGLAGESNAKRLLDVFRFQGEGKNLFRLKARNVVREGCCEGTILGGNLTMLCSLLGTPWEPDFDGAVVLIEEVNEARFRIDRMLTQLKSAGKLHRVNALICGSLYGCTPVKGQKSWMNELLVEMAPEHCILATGMSFGHGARNDAFPIGVRVKVDTENEQIIWS